MIMKFWEKIVFYRNNQQCYQINYLNQLPLIAQFNIGFSVSPNTVAKGIQACWKQRFPNSCIVGMNWTTCWRQIPFPLLDAHSHLVVYSIMLGQNSLIDSNLSNLWSKLGCVHTQMAQRNWTMSICESPAASGWPQMPQFRPPVLSSSRRPPWNRRHRRFNKNTQKKQMSPWVIGGALQVWETSTKQISCLGVKIDCIALDVPGVQRQSSELHNLYSIFAGVIGTTYIIIHLPARKTRNIQVGDQPMAPTCSIGRLDGYGLPTHWVQSSHSSNCWRITPGRTINMSALVPPSSPTWKILSPSVSWFWCLKSIKKNPLKSPCWLFKTDWKPYPTESNHPEDPAATAASPASSSSW